MKTGQRRRSRQTADLRPAVRLERPGDDTEGRTAAVRAAHHPTRGRVPRSSASAEFQRAVARTTPLTRQMVQYRVLRASRRAKLSQDGVHILRHTFCSHLAMRGAPPRAIQELAGHRELGMTQRYMHLSPAALDSAIRLLDQPFSVQSFGDILETGRVSEEKINGSNNLTGGEAGIRTLRMGRSEGASRGRATPASAAPAALRVHAVWWGKHEHHPIARRTRRREAIFERLCQTGVRHHHPRARSAA